MDNKTNKTSSHGIKMFGLEVATIVALSGFTLAAPQNIQYHETPDNSWKSRIKNVVVLVEENRSFDTFAGGLDYNPTIDGLLHHNYCNSMYASTPSNKLLVY